MVCSGVRWGAIWRWNRCIIRWWSGRRLRGLLLRGWHQLVVLRGVLCLCHSSRFSAILGYVSNRATVPASFLTASSSPVVVLLGPFGPGLFLQCVAVCVLLVVVCRNVCVPLHVIQVEVKLSRRFLRRCLSAANYISFVLCCNSYEGVEVGVAVVNKQSFSDDAVS